MQLTTALAEMLQSGKIVVSANNVEALEIKAANKKIDITAISKEFVKDALAATRDTKKGKGMLEGIKGTVGQIKNARGSLDCLKMPQKNCPRQASPSPSHIRAVSSLLWAQKQTLNYQASQQEQKL